jgi:hypothetical protein
MSHAPEYVYFFRDSPQLVSHSKEKSASGNGTMTSATAAHRQNIANDVRAHIHQLMFFITGPWLATDVISRRRADDVEIMLMVLVPIEICTSEAARPISA